MLSIIDAKNFAKINFSRANAANSHFHQHAAAAKLISLRQFFDAKKSACAAFISPQRLLRRASASVSSPQMRI